MNPNLQCVNCGLNTYQPQNLLLPNQNLRQMSGAAILDNMEVEAKNLVTQYKKSHQNYVKSFNQPKEAEEVIYANNMNGPYGSYSYGPIETQEAFYQPPMNAYNSANFRQQNLYAYEGTPETRQVPYHRQSMNQNNIPSQSKYGPHTPFNMGNNNMNSVNEYRSEADFYGYPGRAVRGKPRSAPKQNISNNVLPRNNFAFGNNFNRKTANYQFEQPQQW